MPLPDFTSQQQRQPTAHGGANYDLRPLAEPLEHGNALFQPPTDRAVNEIAAGLAMAVAVAQVVYQALKPTGLFEWLSAATNPEAKRAIDTIPETTV